MKYISIGCAGSVKYNINKYRDKCETLFFDWLMTSMNSVIDILSVDDISEILYFDNIIRDVNIPFCGNYSRIVIKSLDFCVSIHDLPRIYENNEIFEFIDKYKRRFNRIIKYIKSNEKIVFIRAGNEGFDIINKFIETIKKINPNSDFTVVVICNNEKNKTEILQQKNLLYINLNIVVPSDAEWTQSFLNWEQIFLLIENNI